MPSKSVWIIVASLLFSTMSLFSKMSVGHYGIMEIVFYRSLIGLIWMSLVMVRKDIPIGTRYPFAHLKRCASGTGSFALEVTALGFLPLGISQSLSYSSPLFFAIFVIIAALAARQSIDWKLIGILLIGFAGVLLIVRPEAGGGISLAGVAFGLAASFLAACVSWFIQDLARQKEPKERTVFYYMAAGTLVGAIGTLFSPEGFHGHTLTSFLPLLGIGLTGLFAQVSMTYAWTYGHGLLNAVFQFSGIIFGAVYGVLLFGENPDLATLAGMGVILAAGSGASVMLMLRGRKKKTD